ncbi:MAG: Stp1/IreP family PP2C-type Ser/Thr phosphatase [Anaerolineae bacterium]|nr:Stp1/IreP family PP2C-type Ser/Thr phosphatase [Anaerolineae bacterium]
MANETKQEIGLAVADDRGDSVSQTDLLLSTPLPVGTELKEGVYQVREVLSPVDALRRYVLESSAVYVCLNCQSLIENSQELYCAQCGVALAEMPPYHPRFIAYESLDPHAFVISDRLLDLQLEHPGLWLPVDVFVEPVEGSPRAYLVDTEFAPALGTTLPLPHPVEKVLPWGIALAQAMAYLHRHYVVLRTIDQNHFAVKGEEAYWMHLEDARILSETEREQAEVAFARDVQALVKLLFYLLTEKTNPIHAAMLPAPVAALFTQLLAPRAGLTPELLVINLEKVWAEYQHPAYQPLLVGTRGDVGMERLLNEDSLLALTAAAVFRLPSAPVGVFAVADGMGGHDAGDVASRLTVEIVGRQGWNQLLMPMFDGDVILDPQQWVTQVTLNANQAVFSQRKVTLSDMGCTLVLALMVGNTATIANVGDSRAYHLTSQGIEQITTDHSLVERLIVAGQITREEARTHPRKNIIYRMMGDRLDLQVDLFSRTFDPGEALLLCSDGLNGMLRDEEIWRIWHVAISPQEACDRLVEAANHAGGGDNISVVIVQVGV